MNTSENQAVRAIVTISPTRYAVEIQEPSSGVAAMPPTMSRNDELVI